jgi:hypothetical protein
MRQLAPDWLLVPMSRSFSDGSYDQQRWDREELGQYAERVAKIGCTAIIVNSLEEQSLTHWPAFGGAWVIDGAGVVRARFPVGRAGMLVAEV